MIRSFSSTWRTGGRINYVSCPVTSTTPTLIHLKKIEKKLDVVVQTSQDLSLAMSGSRQHDQDDTLRLKTVITQIQTDDTNREQNRIDVKPFADGQMTNYDLESIKKPELIKNLENFKLSGAVMQAFEDKLKILKTRLDSTDVSLRQMKIQRWTTRAKIIKQLKKIYPDFQTKQVNYDKLFSDFEHQLVSSVSTELFTVEQLKNKMQMFFSNQKLGLVVMQEQIEKQLSLQSPDYKSDSNKILELEKTVSAKQKKLEESQQTIFQLETSFRKLKVENEQYVEEMLKSTTEKSARVNTRSAENDRYVQLLKTQLQEVIRLISAQMRTFGHRITEITIFDTESIHLLQEQISEAFKSVKFEIDEQKQLNGNLNVQLNTTATLMKESQIRHDAALKELQHKAETKDVTIKDLVPIAKQPTAEIQSAQKQIDELKRLLEMEKQEKEQQKNRADRVTKQKEQLQQMIDSLKAQLAQISVQKDQIAGIRALESGRAQLGSQAVDVQKQVEIQSKLQGEVKSLVAKQIEYQAAVEERDATIKNQTQQLKEQRDQILRMAKLKATADEKLK